MSPALDLPPVETIIKLLLLQTSLCALGLLAFSRLKELWGRRYYPAVTSGAVLLTGEWLQRNGLLLSIDVID